MGGITMYYLVTSDSWKKENNILFKNLYIVFIWVCL